MRHAFIIKGVVDEEAVRKQAYAHLKHPSFPEASAIHHHREGEPCVETCYLIQEESE